MSENKVSYKELISAKVHVDNSVDTAKTYDISSDINIVGGNIESHDNGIVSQNETVMATFSLYGTNNLSISYISVETESQCDVLNAINEYITNVTAQSPELSPLSL